MEEVEVRFEVASDEGADQIVLDLTAMSRQVDDRQIDAGRVHRVKIAARRAAVASGIEHVAVVPHAQIVARDCLSGRRRDAAYVLQHLVRGQRPQTFAGGGHSRAAPTRRCGRLARTAAVC